MAVLHRFYCLLSKFDVEYTKIANMFRLLSIVCVALVDEENHVFGSDVYQFKTPKKSGQMAQLASESRTPKSQPSSESRTPKSILKTPVQKKDAARRKCMYSLIIATYFMVISLRYNSRAT